MTWEPTAALWRVTVLPAALVLLAVLTRRPDLLVLAAPLALAGVPLALRPTGTPEVHVRLDGDRVLEGAPVQLAVTVEGATGAQTLAVTAATPDGVRPADGGQVVVVRRASGDGTAVLAVALTAQRWGRASVGPGDLTLSACGGLLRAGPIPVPAQRTAVLPLSARYAGTGLLPRPRGNVGLHRSRRLGEGTDLAGVRPFAPGDRMRRINWRTSLRSGELRAGELQVNATTTDRDAEVVVVLDARFDAGTRGVDGRASGVDVAVRAAAALTAFYLGLGDRVGLVAYAAGSRTVPAGAGRGQLDRLLGALLDTSAPRAGGGEPRLPPPPGLDPRALVLVVSPLVGRYVFEQAAVLSRAGHAVVVVDTLPADAVPAGGGPWTAPVTRLWLLERATRIGQLQSLGVPVVGWHGSGTLDAVLLQLSRAAARSGGRR